MNSVTLHSKRKKSMHSFSVFHFVLIRFFFAYFDKNRPQIIITVGGPKIGRIPVFLQKTRILQNYTN